MSRSIFVQPPTGNWVAYEVDESADGIAWRAVKADEATALPVGGCHLNVSFSENAKVFRVVWVPPAGVKHAYFGEVDAIPPVPMTAAAEAALAVGR